MKKRISIKTIAQEVGISNATVSLVLNDKDKEGRVSREMAEKIRKVAKDLNYEPNHLARGLRMGKSQTIGLIVADISNPFFANLAFHIQEYAEKFGYSVIITNTNESDAKLVKILDVLIGHQVDGLIIVPTEHGKPAIEELVKKDFPLVLLDRWYPELQTCYVVIDNYQASKTAVQHLINKKCKRIALFGYTIDLPHMQERKRGYVDTVKKAGLFDENLIKDINYISIDADIKTALDDLFFNEKNEKPDGIFFATNSIALHGLRYMFERGVKVSKDVKAICFDKSDAFDLMESPVPCVLQPIPEMGKLAVDVLINQIVKGTVIPSKVELFAKLSTEE
ncbi:MAG: LacI family transcriptional regulator [Bacteroidales bacterium]|nr:LacI family transcriptional regulator [Bacteroidales bacterium]